MRSVIILLSIALAGLFLLLYRGQRHGEPGLVLPQGVPSVPGAGSPAQKPQPEEPPHPATAIVRRRLDAISRALPSYRCVGHIVFVGRYQTTVEPCGCASGQRGGLASEIETRRCIAEVLADAGRTVLVGDNFLEAGLPLPTAVGPAYRRSVAELIGDYASRTSIDFWAPSAADWDIPDADYWTRTRPALLLLGARWVPTVVGDVRVELGAVDLSHESPSAPASGSLGQVPVGAAIRILIVHGAQGAMNTRSRLSAHGTPHRGGTIFIDVDGGVRIPRGDRELLYRLGQPQGTYCYLLTLWAAGDEQPNLAGPLMEIGDLLAKRLFVSGDMPPRSPAQGFAVDWVSIPISSEFEDAAWRERLVAWRGALKLVEGVGPDQVSAKQCGACHVEQYSAWERSQHARAMDTLSSVGRALDPACVRCHSSLVDGSGRPSRDGIGCTACHAVSMESRDCRGGAGAAGIQTCMRCHTSVASPHFEFAHYKPRVSCSRAGSR